jgi:hypothetical protein
VVSDDPSGAPVFVLAGGGRTGSTLLQRLLISTREVMIWGEHGGVLLDALNRFVAGMEQWFASDAGAASHLTQFMQKGWDSWIPNMNPPQEAFVEGARAALLRSLAVPAAELGYRRWGFKEIRYIGGAIALLKTLFPDARIVVLVRHPEASLRSIKATAFYASDYEARPEIFLARWAEASSSLARACAPGTSVRLWRYEDIVADPEAAIVSLAEHVAVDAARFDRSTMKTYIRGYAGRAERASDSYAVGKEKPPTELDNPDRAALDLPQVRNAAAELGYAL